MEPLVSVVAAATPDGATAADVVLLPGRAAWLPASATLLVADLHLGKAATFRRAGIPVPEGSARRDLLRLEALVAGSAARRLVILGDLFHARTGCTPAVRAEFAAIRARFAATEVWLVLGNHDRQLGRLPPGLGIDAVAAEFTESPFLLVHDPAAARPGLFTIAGHLHPTVTVSAPSGDRLTDRCFVVTADALVLPAFGSFTGGRRVAPAADARLWLARDDGLVEVTRLAAAGAGRRH